MKNDRLKFRVWYGSELVVNNNDLIVYMNMDGSLTALYKWRDEDTSNLDVEFNSEISDINGKDIYVGDIVKTKHDDVGVVIYSKHFLEWRIVFKKGRKHLLDNEEFGVPMFDFTENAIGKNILEIIGNTHQNPELLK